MIIVSTFQVYYSFILFLQKYCLGNIPLHEAFFAPERLLSEGGIDPLLRGLFGAPMKTPKEEQLVNKELTHKLFSRVEEVLLLAFLSDVGFSLIKI